VAQQQLAGELASTSRRLAALEAAADSDVRLLQDELGRLEGGLGAAAQETLVARWGRGQEDGGRCMINPHRGLRVLPGGLAPE
jgi:hypothetical protein